MKWYFVIGLRHNVDISFDLTYVIELIKFIETDVINAVTHQIKQANGSSNSQSHTYCLNQQYRNFFPFVTEKGQYLDWNMCTKGIDVISLS